MRTSLARTLALAAFAILLAAGTAQAQGKGKGHGQARGEGHGYGNGGVPPGLAKKGGMPPGQAKKLYRAADGVVVLRDVFGHHGYTVVRTVPRGDARYVYYRYPDGTLHRAIVRPGSEQLYFGNVPSLLLREVLARLY